MVETNIIGKSELLQNINLYKMNFMRDIFVAPTDTVYGLSCNATDDEIVKKLKELKKINSDKPLSVIAPSKDWIYENCIIDEKAEKWLEKLPGPYTLILKLKNKNSISKHIINKENNSIGVRIPNHWFTEIIKESGIPVVTTSANITGMNFMTSLEDLHPEIKNGVNLIVYAGKKQTRPSTLINLVDKEEIIKR
jgi:L-threonylcarbamoyladenylate synthase